MNIVFVTNTYWPQKNGVQMVNQYLAEGLVTRGHNVIVLTRGVENGLIEEEYHNGVHIKRFSIRYTKYRKYVGDIKGVRQFLLDLNQNGKMDVMISVSANSLAGVCAFPIFKYLKCKKLLYNHGMRDGKLHIDKITSLKSFLKECILVVMDGLFYKVNWKYISQYDAAIHLFPHDSSHEYFLKKGFNNNHVILNACEQALFEDASGDETCVKKYHIDNPYFIFVANYCFSKNQNRAIEAFYKANIMDKDLVLIGSKRNDYCEKILKLLSNMKKKYCNHGKVHILYDVSRTDTISLIRSSYACFMSSMNEYFPITIIEAMATGKPFITTNVGIVSLLPGGNIAHNTKELSYWLEYYARNEEYVSCMGKIASEFAVANLKLEDKILQLEQILNSL